MSAAGHGGTPEGGREWKCPKTGLWSWLDDYINLLKIIKLCSYNGWALWYINYNSIRLFKKKKNECSEMNGDLTGDCMDMAAVISPSLLLPTKRCACSAAAGGMTRPKTTPSLTLPLPWAELTYRCWNCSSFDGVPEPGQEKIHDF